MENAHILFASVPSIPGKSSAAKVACGKESLKNYMIVTYISLFRARQLIDKKTEHLSQKSKSNKDSLLQKFI